MGTETRRPPHRPAYDPTVNAVDFKESTPDLDLADDMDALIDRIYEFVKTRAEAGDPCRWRCLVNEFGAALQPDAHYRISYAVDKLKTARLVKILERIPERIVPRNYDETNATKGNYQDRRTR